MSRLTAVPIASAGWPVVWMAEAFEAGVWWRPDNLSSERKPEGDHPNGAAFKLDLAGPAWLTLVGKLDGVWLLVAQEHTAQPPNALAVAVTGPTLVTIVEETPAPEPEPTPTPAPEPEPEPTPKPAPAIDAVVLWRKPVASVFEGAINVELDGDLWDGFLAQVIAACKVEMVSHERNAVAIWRAPLTRVLKDAFNVEISSEGMDALLERLVETCGAQMIRNHLALEGEAANEG